MEVSVCICTYNGRGRIVPVIEALAQQSEPTDSWEVLVIDNGSTDGTGEFASALCAQLLKPANRVVREDKPGLSFARARAGREAAGDIICFLDDDNVPSPGFVSAVISAFHSHPRAGCMGGKIVPRWEEEPTPLVKAVASDALAICDHGDAPFCYTGITQGPVGAGMCLRRDLLLSFFEKLDTAAISDRRGDSLASGGDTALVVHVHQSGYEVRYEPALHIEHLMPASRMEKQYLLRLYAAFGRSAVAVRRFYDWKARDPVIGRLMATVDLMKWLGRCALGPHRETRRRHPLIASELHELRQKFILSKALAGFKSHH